MFKILFRFLIACGFLLVGVDSVFGATFTVTLIGGNNTSAVGSLRWAAQQANLTPGADIIDFNLVSGALISEDGLGGNINGDIPITEAVTIDATINSMAVAWVTNGSCGPIIMARFNYDDGFQITSPNVTIKGLAFDGGGYKINFTTAAVTSGNVRGCFFGLNIAGLTATATSPSGAVFINAGASGVVIGGSGCSLRNVFVAQNDGGVLFNNGDNNTVIGNYFNTNAAGTAHISPGTSQACIRLITGSTGNIIGTNTAGEGNVMTMSSGQACVFLETASNNNIIRNNIMGFGADGVTGLPALLTSYSDHGVRSDACSGGTVDNCTIGGFNRFGVNLDGVGPNNWTITNSRIGTDATGNVARRNEEGGIFVNTAASGLVVTGNTVSGNGTTLVVGPGMQFDAGCVNCNIQNNKIGVSTSNACLGNSGSGVFIKSTNSALTFLQDNIVGCNGYANLGGQLHGLHLLSCSNINVLDNYTGTTAANIQLGNHQDGISMNSCSSILCQGNTSKYNNWGVFMQAAGGGNIIIGNTINGNGFNNTPLVKPILNEGGGICAQSGSNGNFIGRANAGEGNSIDGNKCGIHLRGDPGGSTGNFVYNNTISNSISGNYTKFATDYSGAGIVVSGGSNSNTIGGTASVLQRNTVNFNASWGVLVDNSDQVEIRRNSIYCNGGTTANKSNPIYAIHLIGGANSAITPPGPIITPPVITAVTGIAIANIPTGDITAGDVVEVYFDNACGCQLLSYRGDATNGGTGQWSFAGASLPAAAYCTPGNPLVGGGTCPPSGMNSVTATRTVTSVTPGRTSEPMSCTPEILPVDLISYEVKRYSETSTIITWATSDEENNAYFQLLRSTDGKRFVPIANIAGAGNSSTTTSYEYIDENLVPATYYYMLVQVDYNNKETMEGIRSVKLDGDVVIDVLPNAVVSGSPVRVINLSGIELLSVSMLDMNGKLVYEKANDFSKVMEIQTTGLAPALYVIRIQTATDLITKKVIVQ